MWKILLSTYSTVLGVVYVLFYYRKLRILLGLETLYGSKFSLVNHTPKNHNIAKDNYS